jgi:CHAP domain-containing protein
MRPICSSFQTSIRSANGISASLIGALQALSCGGPVLKCPWAGHLSAAMLSVSVLGLASCVSDRVALECAPFARERSGVQLYGAAADWWQQADGRYIRTRAPVVGSVLVFRRSSRLSNGHVAVVTRVLSERQILVTHANWVHHRVSEDMPVIDVSPSNNWTMVRVWWPPSDRMGITEYPTYGFILSDRVSYDQLITDTARAPDLTLLTSLVS